MPSGAKCVIRCSPAVADVKGKPALGTQGRRVTRETTTAVAPSQKHPKTSTLSQTSERFKKLNFDTTSDETREILLPVRVNCKYPSPF